MMKRFFTLLLALALLGALAAPALADVAYMPNDSFFEKHWEDCSYENRWYYTNGAKGYVLAHKTPDSAEATPLPNGGKYYISNIYKGEWGVLEYDPAELDKSLNGERTSGWVRMDEMIADYDNAAFEADHAAELKTDSEVELQLTETDVAYGYMYPGSGVVVDEFHGEYFRDPFRLSPLFTDPEGRTWGFIGYYYGRHDCWICIDDPFNGALAPDENSVTIVTVPSAEPAAASTEAPAPTEAPAGKTIELTPAADQQTLEQAAKDSRGGGPWIAAGAAAVVVIAAAVLGAALKKKKK